MALNAARSFFMSAPSALLASLMKAPSLGRNAVSFTDGSASTPTALPGLAPSTTRTARSRTSKSRLFLSNLLPSAASTSARLVPFDLPLSALSAACAGVVPARPAAASSPDAATVAAIRFLMVLMWLSFGLVPPPSGGPHEPFGAIAHPDG